MNCKPGSFAVHIQCPFAPINVGSFYHVRKRCGCHAAAWTCEPIQEVVENVGLMNRFHRMCKAGDLCCVWDRELKPINPGTAAKAKETADEIATV